MHDQTIRFAPKDEERLEVRAVLKEVCAALTERAMIRSIRLWATCFPRSAYITSHKNARILIRKLDRDQILEELVRYYLESEGV